MRKRVAVAGASVLGVGLAAISTVPAQAAPVNTPACSDVTQHTLTVGTLDSDWFMDCVPQYGAGKVNFEITSTETVPASFKALDDPSVSSVFSGGGPTAAAYFGVTGEPNGFESLDTDVFIPTPDIFHYRGNAIFKVASVEAIDPSTLPAGCDATTGYAHAYRVDYDPSTVTFSQIIDGKEWKVIVALSLPSAYLGYNFTPVDPGNPDPSTSAGSFDPNMSQCVIADGSVYTVSSDQDPLWFAVTNFATSSSQPMWPYLSGVHDLGALSLTATPQLAETGTDPAPYAIAGGVLLIGGGAVLLYARRRRRAEHA